MRVIFIAALLSVLLLCVAQSTEQPSTSTQPTPSFAKPTGTFPTAPAPIINPGKIGPESPDSNTNSTRAASPQPTYPRSATTVTNNATVKTLGVVLMGAIMLLHFI